MYCIEMTKTANLIVNDGLRKREKMGKEEFFDEQIIDMMNKAEQKKESSKVNQSETVEERNIYTGVRIFGNGYILNV